jgi:hypothetical protein
LNQTFPADLFGFINWLFQEPILKILIPVDGFRQALDAVAHAMYLQQQGLRASFVLAAVQEPIYGFEMMLPADESLVDRLSGAMGERALAEAEDLCKAAALSFAREIGSGDPAPVRQGCVAKCTAWIGVAGSSTVGNDSRHHRKTSCIANRGSLTQAMSAN